MPFAALTKPLNECRIGVVTSADQGAADIPQDELPRSDRLFRAENAAYDSLSRDKFWDREATNTDDPESYLPLRRLAEYATSGRIGALNHRFFGVPTDYSQRLTLEDDAPRIEAWMREDAINAAILVPL